MNFPNWYYFLALCSDLEKTIRFVEIAPENFKTFSIEYSRLYLAAGSEIDVVAKQLCQRINPSTKADSINQYRREILAKYPSLPTVAVAFWRYNVSLLPWEKWSSDSNPQWWTGYNKVKHERNQHFKEANLENVLNALAGLYVMVGYLHGEELKTAKLPHRPELMSFEGKYYCGSVSKMDGLYCLPGFSRPIWGK